MMIMLLLSLLLFAIFFKATAEVTHTHTEVGGKGTSFFLIFVRSCGKLNNGRKVEEREEKKMQQERQWNINNSKKRKVV